MTTILPRACEFIPTATLPRPREQPVSTPAATLVPVLATATLLRGASPYVAQTHLLDVKQLQLLAAHAPGFVFVNKLRIFEACSLQTVRSIVSKVNLMRELHLHEYCIGAVHRSVKYVTNRAEDFVDFLFEEPMRSAERFSLLGRDAPHTFAYQRNPLSLEQLTRLLTEHPSPGIVDSIARQANLYYSGPKTSAVIELLLQPLEANPFGLRVSTVVSRLVGIAFLLRTNNVFRDECVASLLSPRLLTVFQQQFASPVDEVRFAALRLLGEMVAKISTDPEALTTAAQKAHRPAVCGLLVETAPELLRSITAMAHPRVYLTKSDAMMALVSVWHIIDEMLELHSAQQQQQQSSASMVPFSAALLEFCSSDSGIANIFAAFLENVELVPWEANAQRLTAVIEFARLDTSLEILRLVAAPMRAWQERTAMRLSAASLHLQGPPRSLQEFAFGYFENQLYGATLSLFSSLRSDVSLERLRAVMDATSIVDIAQTALRGMRCMPFIYDDEMDEMNDFDYVIAAAGRALVPFLSRDGTTSLSTASGRRRGRDDATLSLDFVHYLR